MSRYLVTSKIRVTYGVDAENEKEAKKGVIAELKDLVTRLNNTEVVGLGAKFTTHEYDTYMEELPF